MTQPITIRDGRNAKFSSTSMLRVEGNGRQVYSVSYMTVTGYGMSWVLFVYLKTVRGLICIQRNAANVH